VNLLVVDDEASLRDFLTIVFEEDGWHVEAAASVGDGRSAFTRNPPDVVLCDLMLPDGSGIDLLHDLKAQDPSIADARAIFMKDPPDVVLCDLMLPDGSGIDLLREMKAHDPSVPVIMITAHTSPKSAVDALKAGALDYIAKPFDIEELKIIVRKAIERKELEDENLHLRSALEERFTFSNIIGKSPKMQEIFSIVQRIAKTN